MNLVVSLEDIKQINKATFDAFLSSGQYAVSKSKAYTMFGKENIELLITNKLLSDTSDLPGKCKFLISDIITAFHIFKNEEPKRKNRNGIIKIPTIKSSR